MIRHTLILVLAVAALLVSVAAAVMTGSARDDRLHGYVDPTRDSAVPYYVPRPGVSVDLTQYTTDELEALLAAFSTDGIVWLHQIADWSQIEAAQDSYDWSEWDALTEAILAYPDLLLVVHIANPPVWAQDDASGAAISDFSREFALRYGEQIHHYVVAGSLTPACDATTPNPSFPANSAAPVQTVYDAIHAADANATVLAALCTPTADAATLLESRYLLGIEVYADGYALDIRDQSNVTTSDLTGIRAAMVRYGDARKPIWIIGSSTTQLDFEIDRALTEWPWLGGIILDGWNTIIPEQLSAPTGLHAVDSPFAQYSGVWTFGERGADIGWIEDSTFTFTFTGTDLALLVRESDIVAHLYITIDGRPANALPTDPDGNAYLLLTSDRLDDTESLVTVAHDLEPGTHVLHATADALDPDDVIGQWSLAGFAVSDADLRGPYDRQITIAWFSAAIALLAVISVTWHIVSARGVEQSVHAPVPTQPKPISGLPATALGAVASILLMLGMFLTWRDDAPNILRRDSVHILVALVTSGLIYLEPGFILTVATGLVLFIVIARRLEVGLMLTVFWAPFFLFPVELYQFAFPIAEVVLFVTLAAAGFRGLYEVARQYRSSGEFAARRYLGAVRANWKLMDWTVALFVAAGCVSVLWAPHRDAALTELRTLIAQPALFYVLMRILVRDSSSQRRIVLALIASGGTVAAIGLFDFARGESVITAEEGARRLASVYGSPNNVGLLLGRCIPFALAFTLVPSPEQLLKWSIRIGLVLMALAALLTQSVGALAIGIPAGVFTVVVLTYRRRAAVPVTLLIVSGIVGIAIASTLPRFERGLDLTEGTNFYRLRVWQSALNMIEDHPVTGLGPDQFLYAFRGQYIMPDAWEEPTLSHPHNAILDFWTRLGLAGVVIFVAMQAAFWRNATRHYRHQLSDPTTMPSPLVIGTIGCMTNLLAHGMVDNSVFVLDLAFIFMLLLSLAAVFQNNSAIDERSETMV